MDHQQFEIETLLNAGGFADEFRIHRGVDLDDGLPVERKARHPSGPSERPSLLQRARQLFSFDSERSVSVII